MTTGRPIEFLRNRHKGEDIYVIAAGPSAGYISPAFFEGKTTIGVNEVYTRFTSLTYCVRKEAADMAAASKAVHEGGGLIVASQHNCGTLSYEKNDPELCDYLFDHEDNRLTEIDLSVIGSDKLIVSYSTITSAMHLAAYMGAKNIILVGHDCGLLNGKFNFEKYPQSIFDPARYRAWIQEIEPQTLIVKSGLHNFYGCEIYSLNPFINFGLEGNRYER